ncbi:glycosyltransferase family 2 protein [Gibbsiella quercinecans]|uniref:glycosyltransferase family 2 protein n=1 Tax=Gibbsiella quercinecans TaxID=929813 RepID=UPI003A4D90EC
MATRKILSIVLTAHNCEAYLNDALSSLKHALGGMAEGYEIILISDASTDRTAEMLQRFASDDAHAQVFQVEFRNIGKVRNFAIQQCSGEYVTMIDGDDQVLPGSLADIMRYLAATKPDLLLTGLNEIYPHSKQPVTWGGLQPKPLTQQAAIKTFLIHKDFQAHFIGQFIRRALLAAHPFPEFKCYEDAYLFPTILNHCRNIIFSPRGHYLYFKRGNSLSSQIDEQKINLLVEATAKMDRDFGPQYANLIACHWLKIYQRYGETLPDSRNRQRIIARINSIRPLSFLLDPAIRLSFKRKYLQARHGK